MTTLTIPPRRTHDNFRSFSLTEWDVAYLESDYQLGYEWPVSGDNIAVYRQALKGLES